MAQKNILYLWLQNVVLLTLVFLECSHRACRAETPATARCPHPNSVPRLDPPAWGRTHPRWQMVLLLWEREQSFHLPYF